MNLSQLVIKYAARHWRSILIGSFLLMITNGLALLIPWETKVAIDVLQQEGQATQAFYIAIGVLFAAAVVQMFIRIASRWTLFGVGRAVETEIRNDLFTFFLQQEPVFYQKQILGDLVSRLANDISTVRMLFGFALLNVINTIFAFTMSLSMMIALSPTLTLWSLAPFPFLFLIMKVFSTRLHARFFEVQNQLGDMTGFLQEVVSGLEVVQNYGAGDAFEKAFSSNNDGYYRVNIALAKLRGLMAPIFVLIAGIGGLIVLYIGGREVMNGKITLGSFVAFEGYLAMLVWPTMVFSWLFNVVQRGRASMERINDTMSQVCELPPQIEIDYSGTPLLVAKGLGARLGEDEVGREQFVLHPVDFSLAPGEWKGIAGTTGGGKSVLLRTLMGFTPDWDGSLQLSGQAVTQETMESYRAKVAYVPTSPLLFTGTIRDNLSVVGGLMTDERVWNALEMAGLDGEIKGFSEGLETVVGEKSVTLSGGQRQRLGLARALLLERPVLVLDDSLSAVDSETEQVIIGHLKERLQSSVLLSSHRVSLLAGCDHILVLHNGKVVEKGTHRELLGLRGAYHRLHATQTLEERLRSA